MNKKRNFAKMALLGALLCGLASPTFVGCKDYDDDIKELQEQIDANKQQLAEIDALIKSGSVITSVDNVTGGVKVTMSNGQSFTITNGTNGTDGTDGVAGKDGVTWEIDSETGKWRRNGELTDYQAI